ncbi:MAG: hypothetical protein WBE18_07350 [Gammaproteobacteria bacterium]
MSIWNTTDPFAKFLKMGFKTNCQSILKADTANLDSYHSCLSRLFSNIPYECLPLDIKEQGNRFSKIMKQIDQPLVDRFHNEYASNMRKFTDEEISSLEPIISWAVNLRKIAYETCTKNFLQRTKASINEFLLNNQIKELNENKLDKCLLNGFYGSVSQELSYRYLNPFLSTAAASQDQETNKQALTTNVIENINFYKLRRLSNSIKYFLGQNSRNQEISSTGLHKLLAEIKQLIEDRPDNLEPLDDDYYNKQLQQYVIINKLEKFSMALTSVLEAIKPYPEFLTKGSTAEASTTDDTDIFRNLREKLTLIQTTIKEDIKNYDLNNSNTTLLNDCYYQERMDQFNHDMNEAIKGVQGEHKREISAFLYKLWVSVTQMLRKPEYSENPAKTPP